MTFFIESFLKIYMRVPFSISDEVRSIVIMCLKSYFYQKYGFIGFAYQKCEIYFDKQY